jgi:hypothetical protein
MTELLLLFRLMRTFRRPAGIEPLSGSAKNIGTLISKPLFESYEACKPFISIELKPDPPLVALTAKQLAPIGSSATKNKRCSGADAGSSVETCATRIAPWAKDRTLPTRFPIRSKSPQSCTTPTGAAWTETDARSAGSKTKPDFIGFSEATRHRWWQSSDGTASDRARSTGVGGLPAHAPMRPRQVIAIGQPLLPVAPLIGAGEKQ